MAYTNCDLVLSVKEAADHFKDGAIVCSIAYRGKDTKKAPPPDAKIDRSYQPCQTFELEEGE